MTGADDNSTITRARRSSTSGGDAGQAMADSIVWVYPPKIALPTRLDGREKTLGRHQSSDVRLDHDEVSRAHAQIGWAGTEHVIRDLGSRNGLYLNGERVESAVLAPGACVRLGDVVGVVVRAPIAIPLQFGEVMPGLHGGAALRLALDEMALLGDRDLPVLVVGETGTGKELVARALHERSGRRGELVPVNCATLVPSLAEEQLFGHRKGAFTGAASDARGLVRAANRGTLFLDEAHLLPAEVQPKLLRVLEQREVLAVGAERADLLDLRIVSACQEDPRYGQNTSLRADLVARLSGLVVSLPPLRQRREDIVGLFLHHLAEASHGTPKALDAKLVEQLVLYAWPYNVREIVQLSRRAASIHADKALLKRRHFPELQAQSSGVETKGKIELERLSSEQLRSTLEQALSQNRRSVTEAAKALGVSRSRFYRMAERCQLTLGREKSETP